MKTATDRRADGPMGGAAREDRPIRRSAHPPVLESKAYSFWYGPTQALHEVNCAIAPKAITALIGPSGCGKTTFLRSINRLHDLTRVRGTRAISCWTAPRSSRRGPTS